MTVATAPATQPIAPQVFLKAATPHVKPDGLFKVRRQNDEMDWGDLLIEATDRVALQTSGIIFPRTSSVKGILKEVPEVHYRPLITDQPGFQPWRELVLSEPLENQE